MAWKKPQQEFTGRVRKPRDGEMYGLVESMLGASQMRIRCADKKVRLGRLIGKMRKRIWIREGDIILIRPWEIQGDEKGDIIWKFNPTEANWLKRKGLVEDLF